MAFLALKAKGFLGKQQVSSILSNDNEDTGNRPYWIVILGVIMICIYFFYYYYYKPTVKDDENKK